MGMSLQPTRPVCRVWDLRRSESEIMPYTKCPICGGIMHLNLGDVGHWYATYHPGVPVGELVPGKCFSCWPELEADMGVAVRQVLSGEAQVPALRHGVIQRVLSR